MSLLVVAAMDNLQALLRAAHHLEHALQPGAGLPGHRAQVGILLDVEG